MITLIATLKIKEGKMEEAVNALKEIVPKIKASEPGCLEYIPHTVRGDENTIIIYEKYRIRMPETAFRQFDEKYGKAFPFAGTGHGCQNLLRDYPVTLFQF